MNSRVWFLRHWDALYSEGEVDLPEKKFYNSWLERSWEISTKTMDFNDFFEFAELHKDLDAIKRQKVADSIDALIETWTLEDKEIVFMISPFARVLETTMIAIKRLQEKWYEPSRLMIVNQLRECENFERQYLKACVFGWECEINWDTIVLDKSITNPEDKSVTDYFFDEWFHAIPKEYLESIWAYERISSIEKYQDVESRSQKDISRILKHVDSDQFLCMVWHQVFTDRMVLAQEEYKNGGQKPSEILLLDDIWTYERISWETRKW